MERADDTGVPRLAPSAKICREGLPQCVLAPVVEQSVSRTDHPFPHRYFEARSTSTSPAIRSRSPKPVGSHRAGLQAISPRCSSGGLPFPAGTGQAAGRVRASLRRSSTYGKASTQHGRRLPVFPARWTSTVPRRPAICCRQAFKDNSQVIDNAFVELVPWRRFRPVRQTPGRPAHRRPIARCSSYVTTRDREAMPLCVTPATSSGGFPRVRLLGREGDLFQADGTLVSPTDIDAALRRTSRAGAARADGRNAGISLRGGPCYGAPPPETGLAQMLGRGARVNAFRRKFITGGERGSLRCSSR